MEARDARHLTARGSHLGKEVKKVRQAYGSRLNVRPHAHFEHGLVLALYSPERQFARVMESDDAGCFVTLRGGTLPAVEFFGVCRG